MPMKMDENEIARICFLLFFRIGAFQRVTGDAKAFFLRLRWAALIRAGRSFSDHQIM
jgi:hypothetical protein